MRIDLRLVYVALAGCTIVIGLGVHWGAAGLQPSVRDIVGDLLWAAMMLWWVSAVSPRTRVVVRAAAALAICVAVEASQLHHAPVLDAVRRTRWGHLLLGSGFDPRDLLAYSAGVLAAAGIDVLVLRRRGKGGGADALEFPR